MLVIRAREGELMSKEPNFPKVTGRIYKIKCVGDSNSVANMLEDLAERVRNGQIHASDEMFWSMESMGYVKEQYRGKWHEKDREKIK